jgi:hypothetical protein
MPRQISAVALVGGNIDPTIKIKLPHAQVVPVKDGDFLTAGAGEELTDRKVAGPNCAVQPQPHAPRPAFRARQFLGSWGHAC